MGYLSGMRIYPDIGISGLRALHLTGVLQVVVPPGAVRWWTLQARRVSPRPWRRGWDLPWPLTDDDLVVSHGDMTDGELEHPVEDQPSAAGVAAIEAEHEFVQVAVEVRLVRRPWWVPSSHRLAREATRCTPGSSSPGSSPRARAARWLRRSWT